MGGSWSTTHLRLWSLAAPQEGMSHPSAGIAGDNRDVNVLTEVIAPSVAVAASIGGLLVALEQLTVGARLRRQATYWRQEAEAAYSTYGRSVARQQHREAVSRLLGMQLVPGYQMFRRALMLLFALFVSSSLAFNVVTTPEMPLESVAMTPVVLFFTMYSALGISNAVYERRRIVQSYRVGQSVQTRNTAALEGRQTFTAVGWGRFLSLCLTVAGAWCMALFGPFPNECG